MKTLIEIMLVIALIAMVASLVLPKLWAREEEHNPKPKRHKGFRRHWRKIYLLPIGLQRMRDMVFPPRHLGGYKVEFANIGEGTYSDGIKSYIPDAATASRYLLYKKGSDVDHCAITGLNDTPLGPSDDQADAVIPIAIKLLGAVKGTVRVVTDGTVNDGDRVKCGANGQVTQAATADVSFGMAIIPTDCSKAAGDAISIIPAIPAKYAF